MKDALLMEREEIILSSSGLRMISFLIRARIASVFLKLMRSRSAPVLSGVRLSLKG